MVDQRQGAADNRRGGAIIFLQPQGLQRREILGQFLKAAGVAAPKTVDGLIRVADDEQTLAFFGPSQSQLILQRAAVLKFVHQQVGKAPGLLGIHLPGLLQPSQQNIVKIHGAGSFQGRLIGFTGWVQRRIQRRSLVFPAGYLVQQPPRRQGKAQLLQRPGRQL